MGEVAREAIVIDSAPFVRCRTISDDNDVNVTSNVCRYVYRRRQESNTSMAPVIDAVTSRDPSAFHCTAVMVYRFSMRGDGTRSQRPCCSLHAKLTN